MSTLREVQEQYVQGLEERRAAAAEIEQRAELTRRKARAEKADIDKLLAPAKRQLAKLGQGKESSPGRKPKAAVQASTEDRRARIIDILRADAPLTNSQIGEALGNGQGLHFLLASMLKQGEIAIHKFSADPTYQLPGQEVA